MVVDPATKLEIDVGVAAAKMIAHVVPNAYEKAITWWSGKTILVLGPKWAGKTSFMDYLRFATLRTESPPEATTGPEQGNYLILKFGGKDATLIMHVRRPIDLPGELGPRKQMEYVSSYKPHALVLVLDSTSPLAGPVIPNPTGERLSSVSWLREFCVALNSALSSSRKLAKKLKCLMIILNKQDKLTAGDGKQFRTSSPLGFGRNSRKFCKQDGCTQETYH